MKRANKIKQIHKRIEAVAYKNAKAMDQLLDLERKIKKKILRYEVKWEQLDSRLTELENEYENLTGKSFYK